MPSPIKTRMGPLVLVYFKNQPLWERLCVCIYKTHYGIIHVVHEWALAKPCPVAATVRKHKAMLPHSANTSLSFPTLNFIQREIVSFEEMNLLFKAITF